MKMANNGAQLAKIAMYAAAASTSAQLAQRRYQ